MSPAPSCPALSSPATPSPWRRPGTWRVLTLLLLLGLTAGAVPTWAQEAQDGTGPATSGGAPAVVPPPDEDSLTRAAEKAAERWRERLGGQELIVGGGFTATTLRLHREQRLPDDTPARAILTDNADLDLLLQYETQDAYFWELPLDRGALRMGYNFLYRFAAFNLERQEARNALVAEDLGTHANGYLLGVAPSLFVVVGPVYPDSAIYWKAGVAIGIATVSFDADALYRNNISDLTARESVRNDPGHPYQLRHAFYTIEWDDWLLTISIDEVYGSYPDGRFLLQRKSAAVGYRIRL